VVGDAAIPPGRATDARGEPTTDPAAARAGLLPPAAGAKGFGLAFFIEVLTGILSGGAVGAEVRSIYKERDRPINCSHVFMPSMLRASALRSRSPIALIASRLRSARASDTPESMRS